MENTFYLSSYGLQELSHRELTEYSGGHKGVAYHIGYVIGEGIRKVGEVAGVIALFF